jgi:hypothetical protein
LSVINPTDIDDAITDAWRTMQLEHVTSTNSVNFFQIVEGAGAEAGKYAEGVTDLIPTTGDNTGTYSGIFTLRLNFRANENYFIRLTGDSHVTSDEVTISPVWSGTQTYTANPSHAVRVGFYPQLSESGITANIWEPYVTGDLGGYDYINLTTTGDPVGTDAKPDDPRNDGAFEFFNDYMNYVNGNSIDYKVTETIPDGEKAYVTYLTRPGKTQTTFNNPESQNLIQLTKTVAGDYNLVHGTTAEDPTANDYAYYGSIIVRIWIEGWDADCFNVVFSTSFNNLLAFEGFPTTTATEGDTSRTVNYLKFPTLGD